MSMHMEARRVRGRRRGMLESPGTMTGRAGVCRHPANRAPRACRHAIAVLLSAFVLALACLPPAAQAATRQVLRVSLTILPAEDVRRLPIMVQRLDAVQPGYGDRWAHARRMAATDPLQAVRSLRRVHAGMLERPGAGAWEGDMAAAGQALFVRDGEDAVVIPALAGR